MDKEEMASIKKALEISKSKGNDRLSRAFLQALEDQQRELKKRKAA
tara:strand:- start:257 stop:394 length:138 start_codon:yes stop_codon:yes gene_type:complete